MDNAGLSLPLPVTPVPYVALEGRLFLTKKENAEMKNILKSPYITHFTQRRYKLNVDGEGCNSVPLFAGIT